MQRDQKLEELTELLRRAHEQGHDIKVLVPNDQTTDADMLRNACKHNFPDVVSWFLRNGSVPCTDCLYYACLVGSREIVDMILRNDIRKSLDYNFGLMGACAGGHIELVQLMINGPNDKPDLNGALIRACTAGHLSVVQLLISLGAKDFDRALFYAVREGHMDTAMSLLEKGAVYKYIDACTIKLKFSQLIHLQNYYNMDIREVASRHYKSQYEFYKSESVKVVELLVPMEILEICVGYLFL
jgi:hypothetical protein